MHTPVSGNIKIRLSLLRMNVKGFRRWKTRNFTLLSLSPLPSLSLSLALALSIASVQYRVASESQQRSLLLLSIKFLKS